VSWIILLGLVTVMTFAVGGSSMDFSLLVHGTALVNESSEGIDRWDKKGWGAAITFTPPAPPDENGFTQDKGVGNWFHLPIPSSTHFFHQRPTITSVLLQFDANRCRITDVHVYDGKVLLERLFVPTAKSLPPSGFMPGVVKLSRPYPVNFGIGISLFALWYSEDLDKEATYDESILFFESGGACFHVDDPVVIEGGSDTFITIKP
jgi:hypothetical protein